MNPEEIRDRISTNELSFATSRSSGPGGQNVNKVNTKVELRFNINDSPSLSVHEKELILKALKNRINNSGELLIISQSERTQPGNRKKAEEIFFKLLAKALTVKPARKATKPTKASKAKRIEEKKRIGILKNLRKEASGYSGD